MDLDRSVETLESSSLARIVHPQALRPVARLDLYSKKAHNRESFDARYWPETEKWGTVTFFNRLL